jgi:putative spermidine/putrescine transport system substrate-binding protein
LTNDALGEDCGDTAVQSPALSRKAYVMTNARFSADLVEIGLERLTTGEINRRGFMAGMAALGLSGMFAGSKALADTGEIVFVNYGGDAVPAYAKAWGEPFTEKTGVKLSVLGAEPTPGAIKAMVESGNIIWDAVDADAFYLKILASQKLIQPYDYTKVDKTKVRPEFVFENGCSVYFYSTVNAYNSEKTGGKAPKGYRDYLNFKDFPGKRAIYKWLVGSLEAVLIGAGVEPKDLYPLNLDKAFGLIRDHKDEFVVWGGGAASQQIFRDNEVVMGPIWNTRAKLLERESNGKFTWTWDTGLIAPGVFPVITKNPAGSKVFDWIASTQAPERQVALLDLLGQSPANPAADALLTPEQQRASCSYAPNYAQQIAINSDWYAENYDAVQNDFLDILAS